MRRGHLNTKREPVRIEPKGNLGHGELEDVEDGAVYPVKEREHGVPVSWCRARIGGVEEHAVRPQKPSDLAAQCVPLVDERASSAWHEARELLEESEAEGGEGVRRAPKHEPNELAPGMDGRAASEERRE